MSAVSPRTSQRLRVRISSSGSMLPSEVRLRAQVMREAAQRLVKQSQELKDNADVLIREAEARALRVAAGPPCSDEQTTLN